jgi:antitoxin VapB
MVHTTIFRSNRSQAVRIPKDVAFPDNVKQVSVLRDGKRRVIVPAEALWDDFFDAPGIALGPREQPDVQARDEF